MAGGVEQVVIGLASALSRLEDGDEEYLFLAHPDADEWLRPYMAGPCRLVHSRMEYPEQGGALRIVRRAIRARTPGGPRLARSDGTLERAGAEVVHFPVQEAFLTELPSIYHPQDLLHLNMPELFDDREIARREGTYRPFCEDAELVCIMTEWGKRDLVDRYGLAPEKVAVVPLGSVLSDYPDPAADDLAATRLKLGLPEAFLLYPAQTWPHKNHENLFEALALLREGGLEVPLLCPGRRGANYPQLAERIGQLGLGSSVSFPGFVEPIELGSLYQLARALVFPSRFEGWGMPVCEAFEAGLPVISSRATVLPEIVGDAGILFDPDSPEEIADAIARVWSDPDLRTELVGRGRRRAELFSFDRTARMFRAHYRALAGRPLIDDDRILLAAS